jgi:hypothetical protein
MANNPKDIDTKEELIAFSLKTGLDFLKKHYWKLILVILSLGASSAAIIFLYKLISGVFK